MKALVAILVVIAVGIAGFYLWNSPRAAVTDTGTAENTEENNATRPTTAMRVQGDSVIVNEQRPGNTLKAMVFLSAPGYLVIHEDKDGEAGAIIGSSALLQVGDNTDTTVTLSRAMKDGESLHAMLHFEKGGNTTFSAAEDTPVPSSIGGPIMGNFEVSKDAPVDVPINI